LSALQRAIQDNPSFPAFTANIQELLAIHDSPYKTVHAVSAIILRDLSLTTQILKIVNSIFFQTYQRQVHTVSSAVMVLGFDRLRDLAVGLRLFENFSKSPNLSLLQHLIVLSFLTAIQAQELVQDDPQLKAEEVFITGLLFNIGELIVAYYLPGEYQRILLLIEQGEAKSSAAQRVLKSSMEEVGLAILKDWNLPDSMVKRLSLLHSAGGSSVGLEGRLRKMIKGAFELAKNMLDPGTEPEERRKREERVCKNLDLDSPKLAQLQTASKKRLHEMAQVLRIDLKGMEISDDIRPKDAREPIAASAPKSLEPSAPPESKSARTAQAVDRMSEDLKRLQFLYQVVEEVNQALVSQASINQVLLMILEGIFRGLRFHRVIFSLVNTQRTFIAARFGLGEAVEELLPLLNLPLENNINAFALAMGKRQEYLVDPQNHPGDRALMAENYWRVSRSHCFLVVPLHVEQIPIGSFYVDRVDPGQPITEEDRRCLRIYRDLTIIALRLSKKAKIFE